MARNSSRTDKNLQILSQSDFGMRVRVSRALETILSSIYYFRTGLTRTEFDYLNKEIGELRFTTKIKNRFIKELLQVFAKFFDSTDSIRI